MPRIEFWKNCAERIGRPLLTTVHTSETSGIIASANADHTSTPATRSAALRGPSTARDQAGSPTASRTQPIITAATAPTPPSSTASTAMPTAMPAARPGA